MYHTGLDPFTGEEVYTAKHLRDRKLQRALLQFFKPENYFEVREALQKAGRQDLVGSGCDALIPANPPKVALQPRMAKANKSLTEGRYVHTIPNGSKPSPGPEQPSQTAGYRPHRKSASRRPRPKKSPLIPSRPNISPIFENRLFFRCPHPNVRPNDLRLPKRSQIRDLDHLAEPNPGRSPVQPRRSRVDLASLTLR